MARAVLPETPHHVTQRGVNRQAVFQNESDRRVYLDLVSSSALHCGVKLIGYCLMPNHVHWIAVPPREDSLARLFGDAHNRYAHYVNAKWKRSGHLWQNRFFSCALDEAHQWAALRYVERNPVRASLVAAAEGWGWSSARAHAGSETAPEWLSMESWTANFTCDEWRVHLALDSPIEVELALRRSTHTGRPLGSTAFVQRAEALLGRKLGPQKGGRPPKPVLKTSSAAASTSNTLFDL